MGYSVFPNRSFPGQEATLPAIGNVEAGVQYGIGGDEFTGVFVVPLIEDVEADVQYGANGTEFTGTLGAVIELGDVRLDQTAKIYNVQKSFKRYIIDNVNRIENIRVSFDKDLSPPQKQGVAYDSWLSVNFGSSLPDTVAIQMVRLVCCARKDTEADDLSQMVDVVMGYLTDITQTNKERRIPLYNISTWAIVGSMLVFIDSESGIQESTDGTKFKIINLTLKWGAKV